MSVGGTTSGRQLIVIGGPGRSGTSLVTGLIGRLGYHIPQPELAANANNPRGYGESVWPLNFHKQVMAEAGLGSVETRPDAIQRAVRVAAREAVRQELAAWLAGEFESADRIVIKDPRIVWFVDLYRDVAETLGARFGLLTMVRHPAETVRSARMREERRARTGRSAAAAAAIEHMPRALEMTQRRVPPVVRTAGWINGALTIERTSRAVPRAFVDYEKLMADWHLALKASEQALGMGLISSATQAQIEDAAQLVEPSLRRSSSDWSVMRVPRRWQSLATSTFEALLALSADAGDERAERELDRLSERFRASYRTGAMTLAWPGVESILALQRRRRAGP